MFSKILFSTTAFLLLSMPVLAASQKSVQETEKDDPYNFNGTFRGGVQRG